MNYRFTTKRLAAAALWATLPALGHAQDAVATGQLPATVVTAARVEQPLAEALPSVTVLTRADIERLQASSLADLLQGEAGFEFGRNGGPGTVTSFFVRGQASTNLVVLIDGVRTMTDGFGSLTSIDLPLSQIERIELLRGNASALYGEAAIGGVLQIFTRPVNAASGSYGSATLGSRSSSAYTAGHAGQVDDLSYRFDVGTAHDGGFSAMNPGQNTRVNPDNDPVDSKQASGKLAKRISDDLTLGLHLSTVRTEVSYDNGSSPAVATDVQQLRRDISTVGVYADGRINADWKSRVDLSRGNFELRDYLNGQPNTGSFSAGLSTGQQTALRWFNTYTTKKDQVVNFGVDTSEEYYTSDATSSGYRATRQLRGYFAGLNQSFGALSSQVNVRYDTVGVNKFNTIYAKTWEATSGLIGLGWRFNEAWRMTASVSTGFRAPSAGELSNNIDLKPETHLSQELGLAYARGDDSWRVVAFDTRTNDAIYFQSVSPFTPINIGKVHNQGVELFGATVWQDMHLRANLVFQDPWDESNGTRLARRARQYGSLDAWRNFGATTAGVKFNVSDDRYDSGSPDKLLPGYSTVSLYASHPVSRDWTLRLKAENALDRPHQLAYGYNAPPFGVWLTLAYQQH